MARAAVAVAAALLLCCGVAVAVAAAAAPTSVALHRRAGARSDASLSQGSGEFYAQVGLGTPAQYFTVILDSGSSTLAVPSTTCSGCSLQGGFNSGASSSAAAYACSSSQCTGGCSTQAPSSCGFSISYGDGSGVQGALIYDTLTFGGLSAQVSFGTFFTASSSFQVPPAQGILGLAYSSLDCLPANPSSSGTTCNTPALQQLLSANGLPAVFSLCLGDPGVMTIGGTDPQYYSGSITYTPIIASSYYVIQMNDLYVGGSSIGAASSDYNNGNAIIDSGTTDLVLPQTAYNLFVSALTTALGGCNPTSSCCAAPSTDPGATIVLQGVSLPFPWTAYLSGSPGCYQLTGVQSQPDGSGTIIGQTVLASYYTVFDQTNTQVGFATANCQSTGCGAQTTCGACTQSSSCQWCEGTSACQSTALVCPNSVQYGGTCSSGALGVLGGANLEPGVVVGIVLGCVGAVVLFALVVLLVVRFRANRARYSRQASLSAQLHTAPLLL